ncbi:MAG TPA: type II toxin-antitoxin system VapC family toxin [Bryobacteraceae bacterium]|nr:type II toxin-antitoxin system VapC family toxin [Bryobacteraceae bacterium]
MATFLLDTNIVIDVLNNKRRRPALLRELLDAGHELACCPINVTEVYAGMRPNEETATEALIDSLRFYPISLPAARLAGGLKREYRRRGATLNLGDVMIAAVAIHNQLFLITDNVKDFPMDNLSLYPLPPA